MQYNTVRSGHRTRSIFSLAYDLPEIILQSSRETKFTEQMPKFRTSKPIKQPFERVNYKTSFPFEISACKTLKLKLFCVVVFMFSTFYKCNAYYVAYQISGNESDYFLQPEELQLKVNESVCTLYKPNAHEDIHCL